MAKTVSRRAILVGSAAALVFPYFRPARAQPDPETVITVGATVIGAISNLKSLFGGGNDNDAEILHKLDHINDVLTTVVKKEDQILEAIHELKLYVNESLYDNDRRLAAQALNNMKNGYDVIMASTNLSNDVIEMRALEIQDATANVGNYDVGTYIPYMSGVLMTLSLMYRAKMQAQAITVAKSAFVPPLARWLDPKDPSSVTTLIANLDADINKRVTALQHKSRDYLVHRDWWVAHGNQICNKDTQIHISGDYPAPFTASTYTVWRDCSTPPPPREHELPGPKGPCKTIDARCPAIADNRAVARKLLQQSYAQTLTKLQLKPSKLLTGPAPTYTQLDQFNNEEGAIKAEVDRSAQLKSVASQLKQLVDELASGRGTAALSQVSVDAHRGKK